MSTFCLFRDLSLVYFFFSFLVTKEEMQRKCERGEIIRVIRGVSYSITRDSLTKENRESKQEGERSIEWRVCKRGAGKRKEDQRLVGGMGLYVHYLFPKQSATYLLTTTPLPRRRGDQKKN